MTRARLLGHFPGLTWTDLRGMKLRDFNALVDAMVDDLHAADRAARARAAEDEAPDGPVRRTRLT